jgi:DNA polymerase-4
MDAFYASVELLRYPELRGQPVVIGGGRRHAPIERDGVREFATLRHYAGRGVITTATYAARTFGVHSGMGLMKAAALAPDAVLLPTDFDEYRRYSRMFKAAVAAIAPDIEDRGIDEIYIDLTALPGETRELVERIKRAVLDTTGLTCSVGVAPNKLLAKLCSELDKPDGITILREADIPLRIWPLPVARVNGIGPKATRRLEDMGIRTIGQLAGTAEQRLIDAFGQSYGHWLHEAALGRDERPVVTYSEPKSISRETTFERDLHPRRDRAQLAEIFTNLCTRVSEDLVRKGYAGKTIGIKLRFEDFRTVTRDQTLDHPTAQAAAIRRAASACIRRVPLQRKLRLMGVRVGSLVPAAHVQAEVSTAPEPRVRDLFEEPQSAGAGAHEARTR